MKKILLACAFTTLFVACSPVEYDTFGAITGTVVDSDSGEPLGQVTVTLKPGGLNTYTGDDGHFDFRELEADTYNVWVQKPGYGATNKDVIVYGGETSKISFTMKKQ